MIAFSLKFYKGDTPTITVSLEIEGQNQSLSQYSVKLYLGDLILEGTINGTIVNFFIDKEQSNKLTKGNHKAWIQFQSAQTKYSYQGLIRVEEARG